MALVLGLAAVTARNTAPTLAAPTWDVCPGIRDETINMQTALADVTTRAAAGWRLQVGTLSEGTIDTQMLYDTLDPDFVAFQAAFFAKTRVLMGFFDKAPTIPGAQGLIGGFAITNFSINRQLEEAITVDISFTAREDDAGLGPRWITTT
jgi:predicted secreted protein